MSFGVARRVAQTAATPLWIRRIAWAGCDTAQKLDSL